MTKRGILKALCIICSVLAMPGRVSAESLAIVSAGKPKARIVISNQAGDKERYAAEQLQEYIKKMSKATLPITDRLSETGKPFISIGDRGVIDVSSMMTRQEAEAGSFLLRTTDNGLFIKGGTSEGTLFGVYAFLEEIGCRFYAPGDNGEVIPAKADISIDPVNSLEKPSFTYRWFDFYTGSGFLSFQGRRDFADWKNKLRLGGPVEKYAEGYGFNMFMPVEKYWDKHPEWYELRAGKRRRFSGRLCSSNPQMRKEFAKNVLQWFKDNPEMINCPLSPQDGPPSCDCENCKALDDPRYPDDLTRRMIHFANYIAEEVVKVYPDKYVSFYCPYNNMYHVPTDLKPHPHIIPQHCDTGNANSTFDDPRRAEDKRALSEWAATDNKILTHSWLHMGILEWPQAGVLAKNLEFLHESGVFGFYCGVMGYSPSLKISMYVMARKLWDVNADVDVLLDEYYTDYYGPAASSIRAYHDKLEKVWYERHPENGSGSHRAHVVFAPDVCTEYAKYVDQARASVSDLDNVYKRRVDEAWLSFRASRDEGQVAADVFDAMAGRQLEKRKKAAESLGRAEVFLEAIRHLDVVNGNKITDLVYRNFADAVCDPRPRTIHGLSEPMQDRPGNLHGPIFVHDRYEYYYDMTCVGALHARDALSMKGGFELDWTGIFLKPKSEGEILMELAASEGKVFDEIEILRLGFAIKRLAESRVEISTDLGTTFKLLAENPDPAFHKDLTSELNGKVGFILRFWGRNDSDEKMFFLGNPVLNWSEKNAPEGTLRNLLTTERLKNTPEIKIDLSKYTFDDIPDRPLPDRIVLFDKRKDVGGWMDYHHKMKVEGRLLHCLFEGVDDSWAEIDKVETGKDFEGRTYTTIDLLPGRNYKVSFNALVKTGPVLAMAEVGGYKSGVLTIPQNKSCRPYSYIFKTPASRGKRTRATITFTTNSNKADFFLDNVVIELQ